MDSDIVGLGLPLVLGYILGSIPFGIIVTRLAGAGDLRTIGSGNIGATNVLRTGRKGLAAATLVGDALKGTLAVVIALRFGADAGLAAAVGALIGHLFPVWLRFRGGKGVATYLGVLIGLAWPIAVLFALVWLAIAFATRYSSFAALMATLSAPIGFVAMGAYPQAMVFFALAAIVWWKHSANIARLRAGTESRIGQKG